jgi:hydroxymethylpyrimidine pyrophosphatase-like HAD family hydrolase
VVRPKEKEEEEVPLQEEEEEVPLEEEEVPLEAKRQKSDGAYQQQKQMIVVKMQQMQVLRQAMQRYQDKRDPRDRYKPHAEWAPKGLPKGSLAQMLQQRIAAAQAEAAANL